MYFVYAMFILAILLIWLPWLWRYQIQPYYAKSELTQLLEKHPQGQQFKEVNHLLETLYRGINPGRVSQKERKRLNLQDDTFTYGEINFLSFALILDKAHPQPGEIFYDLGSGSGKAIFVAAFNYNFHKVCGIELIPGLNQLAKMQMNKAKTLIDLQEQEARGVYTQRLSTIQWINGNFMAHDISDGDIIFINATCLNYYDWQTLVHRFTQLKVGSRIIVTTKKIESKQFETLYHDKELMSWGLNTVHIYKKII